MIIALQIGKGKSVGCPGKNTRAILGRPLMEYPSGDVCLGTWNTVPSEQILEIPGLTGFDFTIFHKALYRTKMR
jgi:hypothetical protein